MSYKTKQKDLILNYLKENSNKCLTINEIYLYLNKNNNVGLTTIYRYLKQLQSSGLIKKYMNNKLEYAYQYFQNTDCQNHIHLKCNVCNNIIHFDCEEINNLNNHLSEKHDFSIDNSITTIYGICKECKNNEKN